MTYKNAKAQTELEKYDIMFPNDDGQPSIAATKDLLFSYCPPDKLDKSHNPASLHPVRIYHMLPEIRFSSGQSDQERSELLKLGKNRALVALLHDCVEEGFVTIDELKKHGYSLLVTDSLRKLSRHEEMPYSEYIQNIIGAPKELAEIIVPVKLLDTMDNLSATRLNKSRMCYTKKVGGDPDIDEFNGKKLAFQKKLLDKYDHSSQLLQEEVKKYVRDDEWSRAAKFTLQNRERALQKYNSLTV